MAKFSRSLFASLVMALLACVNSQDTIHRHEQLDSEGNYILDWVINYPEENVRFTTTVKTKGFVGFGISNGGGMTGADIVIGGVADNGNAYFNDCNGVGTVPPVIDAEQSWTLISAEENDTHTVLEFSRKWNTCDDEDTVLTNDTTNWIWSYGDTDTVMYHGATNRGTFQTIPLDPELPEFDTERYKTYEIVHEMTMPSEDTTYWCTIQKSPVFTAKSHIVAFEPKVIGEYALSHTHHYAIFRCTPPEGENMTWFEQFVGNGGGGCKAPNPQVPNQYCQQMFYTWAVGGKKLIFPDDIGCPVGGAGNEVEYYMFEVHYNNPEEHENRTFETGATIYYTEELREKDAGILMVAHQTSLALLVPPESESYLSVGHCAPYCTQKYLPEEGIHVFALLHHAHLAGRKMKLRHFRGNLELPWVKNDENYDFEYQQTRPMHEEVVILPGDHLTTECHYSTLDRQGVTIGGLATTDEMCQSTFWYWPKMDLRECRSEYQMTKLLPKFGIEEIDERQFMYDNVQVLRPESLAGIKFTDVLNNPAHVNWTASFREELQRDSVQEKHEAMCYIVGGTGSEPVPELISYPEVTEEFVPIDMCQNPEPVSTTVETTKETTPIVTTSENTTPESTTTTPEVTTTTPKITTTTPEITTEDPIYSSSTEASTSTTTTTTASPGTTTEESTSVSTTTENTNQSHRIKGGLFTVAGVLFSIIFLN